MLPFFPVTNYFNCCIYLSDVELIIFDHLFQLREVVRLLRLRYLICKTKQKNWIKETISREWEAALSALYTVHTGYTLL